jgi:single-strand DNA-binding protein
MKDIDSITLIGNVGSAPKHTMNGTRHITTFRLASNQRRFDREKNIWVDGDPNWYTVKAFNQFAVNVAASIAKGDPVVVTGRLRVRDWESDERSGTNVDVEADAIGPNLFWGKTSFDKVASSSPSREEAREAEDPGSGLSWAVGAPGGAATPDVDDVRRDAQAIEAPATAPEKPGGLAIPF